MRPLELWAGAECTVNRVGDVWSDQMERTGHSRRLEDMDRLAHLGAKSVRFPVLWERTVTSSGHDWSWSDVRLARLRELGVAPIVGLLHHGSGPEGTDLLDPDFPAKLAEFAGAVARRYPWVESWTPINEPLTTARFSALYGHWYPHRHDTRAFLTALLHECRATGLAMRAIREVVPGAQLLQTEELGSVRSSPELAYQADFENQRRWLGLDLLAGRVDRHHPLAEFLAWGEASPRLLAELADEPCPADIVGVNYYVTSERYLDARLHLYPEDRVGGNGRDRYVDVEAVRVCSDGLEGLPALLVECAARYGTPLVISEAHLSGHREDQLRWLRDRWADALAVREEGVDLRAMTVWAAFGAVDWHNLVTRFEDRYEPGCYDGSSGEPRPTALVRLCQQLAAGGPATHPALAGPGWWERGDRLLAAVA